MIILDIPHYVNLGLIKLPDMRLQVWDDWKKAFSLDTKSFQNFQLKISAAIVCVFFFFILLFFLSYLISSSVWLSFSDPPSSSMTVWLFVVMGFICVVCLGAVIHSVREAKQTNANQASE